MSSFLQVIATYLTKEGEEDAVRSLLPGLAAASRAEEANLGYEVSQDIENPRRFVILERYIDESGLDAHRATEHFSTIALGGIIPRLESRTVQTFTSTEP